MDSLAGLRTGAYLRYSSENQRETSIEDQLKLCRDHVNARNGVISDELTLHDSAMSGAKNDRQGFDQLMRLVEAHAVDVIVCEAADRLSRDLGDADRIWKMINFHNVRLICVSDGIDSANEHSRMVFRIKAMFADEYLVDLGKKTARGLFGAAERGHSTGGLPYGYTSKPIWGDEREPIGWEITKDEQQALVVQRIYEMYRSGQSFLTIALTLNKELIPPPRAKSKKRPSKFWKKGTIREMLRNPAYVGVWSYGRKKWTKDPTTRKRRYKKRPQDQVKKSLRPHLIIVEPELWDQVRERRESVTSKYKGKPGAPGQRTKRPFSGLLVCGVCGTCMVDGGGSSARYYRCSRASSGGICSNKQPLRGDVLERAAIDELKRVLVDTSLHDQLRSRIEARLKTFSVRSGDERKRLEGELVRLEREVERLLGFVRTTDPATNPGAFEATRTAIEKATQEQRQVTARLEVVGDALTIRLPTVDEILAHVLDIEARIKQDPVGAREVFRQLLLDGRLAMQPQPDGSYIGRSVVFPMHLKWKTRKPRSASPTRAFEVVEGDGCAGRI